MKLRKDGKKLVFFIFILVLSSEVICLNTKFSSNQILEKKDHEIEIFKNSKITPKNIRFFSNTNSDKVKMRITEPINKESNDMCILQFLRKILITYLQFFLLFCILSFYKFFEELNQIKLVHIAGKYSEVKDLTSEKYKDKISELNGENIFISGDTKINQPATDEVLQINLEDQYAMIYRTVEIFNSKTESWIPLLEDHSDKNMFNEDNPQITLLNEYFIEVCLNGQTFKFPKLFSMPFIGEVEINGITLSPQQIKNLEKSESIKFPLYEIDAYIFTEFDRRNPQKINWESNYDCVYVYPCDIENPKKSQSKLRISLKGYPGKTVTILAKLHNNTFKTYNTPYIMGEEDAHNQTKEVNLSSNMITESNMDIDFCNLLFCFCLSGPPSYHEKENKNIQESQYMITKTNWIIEKKMTFDEMIHYKYDISSFRNNIIRFIFFYSIIVFFALSEEPLYILYKFTTTIEKEKISEEFIKFNLIASIALFITIFSLSKISYKFRHLLSMCTVIFLITVLIILIIKELLLIN